MSHPLLDEGLDELVRVLEGTASLQSDRLQVVADLSVARGLDYYTGTVFETRMVGFEHLGSICSGGRYDALATDGRTTYPGVGISFGVTRTLGAVAVPRAGRPRRGSTPTCVLVALPAEDDRGRRGRDRGRRCAAAACPSRCRRPRRSTASRSATPSAAASRTCGSRRTTGRHQVRDIRTGEQVDADPRRGSHRRRTCARP